MHVIIATTKSWNLKNVSILKKQYPEIVFYTISQKEELNLSFVQRVNPDFVFFPHWSWIIPEEIFNRYPCIVFHMTDLPFGRGGSPLQNLIVRGIKKTKISAIRVAKGMDTGDIYMKCDLDISIGSADEILQRASKIVFTEMIPKFLSQPIIPMPQLGNVVEFKRRKPEDSEIFPDFSCEQIYNYIRMLDGEGYPQAFISFGSYQLRFCKADNCDGVISAMVTFNIKEDL